MEYDKGSIQGESCACVTEQSFPLWSGIIPWKPGFTFLDPKQHREHVLLIACQFRIHSAELQAAQIKHTDLSCGVTSLPRLPHHLARKRITPTFLPLPTHSFQSTPSSELITSSHAAAPPAWIYNTQIYSVIFNKYIYLVGFFFFFEHKPPFPVWTRVQITITG